MKYTSILVICWACWLSSCGGGGGGSSTPQTPSSSTAVQGASTATYAYELLSDSPQGKEWSGVSQGKVLDFSADPIVRKIQPEFAVTDQPNAYEIFIDYDSQTEQFSLNYDITLSTSNTDITRLIDGTSGVYTGALLERDFANGSLRAVLYDPAFLAAKFIDYANILLIETFLDSGREDTFPGVFGDITQPGDLQTTGTLSYTLEIDVIFDIDFFEPDQISVRRQKILGSGTASISADLSNKTINGNINIERFYDYEIWVSGDNSGAQLLDVPTFSLELVNGVISGEQFSAEVSVDNPSSGLLGAGTISGAFFGPDGYEIGVSFSSYQANDDESGLAYWDLMGAGIGR